MRAGARGGIIIGASVEIAVGDGLELSEYRAGDADALVRHLASGEVGRTLPDLPRPYGRESAERFLSLRLAELEGGAGPTRLAVRRVSDGELCGAIGLRPASAAEPHGDPRDRSGERFDDESQGWCELGYWLAAGLWGRGIMSAVVPGFLGYASAIGAAQLVTARCLRSNAASLRILEANGFLPLGGRRVSPPVGGRRTSPGPGEPALADEVVYFGRELR